MKGKYYRKGDRVTDGAKHGTVDGVVMHYEGCVNVVYVHWDNGGLKTELHTMDSLEPSNSPDVNITPFSWGM